MPTDAHFYTILITLLDHCGQHVEKNVSSIVSCLPGELPLSTGPRPWYLGASHMCSLVGASDLGSSPAEPAPLAQRAASAHREPEVRGSDCACGFWGPLHSPLLHMSAGCRPSCCEPNHNGQLPALLAFAGHPSSWGERGHPAQLSQTLRCTRNPRHHLQKPSISLARRRRHY